MVRQCRAGASVAQREHERPAAGLAASGEGEQGCGADVGEGGGAAGGADLVGAGGMGGGVFARADVSGVAGGGVGDGV